MREKAARADPAVTIHVDSAGSTAQFRNSPRTARATPTANRAAEHRAAAAAEQHIAACK